MGGCEESVVAIDEAERSRLFRRHVVSVFGVGARYFLGGRDQDGVVVP